MPADFPGTAVPGGLDGASGPQAMCVAGQTDGRICTRLAVEYFDGSSWVHTPVTLHSQCWNNNPDCPWIYQSNRMIVSVRNQSFAINAWGGAGQDVALVLTQLCTPDNPDCTWSLVDGQFVNDRYPTP